MSKILIAIDPGKSGGFAWSVAGKAKSEKMPDTEGDLLNLFEKIESTGVEIVVYLEKVGGFNSSKGGQPGSSSFTFGKGYGFIQGVIMSKRWPLHLVTPQAWMKTVGVGTRGKMTDTQWKNKLKAEAQRLFPHEKVTLYVSDALLILQHAMKQERDNRED